MWVQTDSADSESEVDDLFGGYVEQGYEGGIIRLNGVKQKRSNNLLKRKDFEDAEFEIISVEEGQGNWSAMPRHCLSDCLTALYSNPAWQATRTTSDRYLLTERLTEAEKPLYNTLPRHLTANSGSQ